MDRVSELPDSVLAHTLSFLPTKDAIKTTLLSKRFENQWTSVTNLSFHETNATLQFVTQALALWGGANNRTLNKFDIEFTSTIKDVRVFVRFAIDHSVKHLRLIFCKSSWDNSASFFTLPQYFYSNSSVESFELACCVLSPRTQVNWCHLKKLTIKCVKLSNELIKNLICGSVQLELFEICDCKGYDSLVIASSSLKTLKISNNFEESDTPVTISAPNITKLCISGVWHRKITLVCLSALVDSQVSFFYRSKIVQWDQYSFQYRINEYIEKVVEQLHCHHSIESLLLGVMFIEALTLADVKILPRQLSKCRSLTLSANTETTLSANTETNVLKGILNLVKMVPNLEVLILDMEFLDEWYSSESAVENFLMSEVEDCSFLFQHLKIVKITCHVDRCPVLPFIKFLLEHARALETMSIFPKTASYYSVDYMFQLIQDLSDMPRSSPVANVVLCKGHTKIQV